MGKGKIAFVHTEDANDKDVFSGIPYNIYQHLLNKYNNVILLSPLKVRKIFILKLIAVVIKKFLNVLSNKTQIDLYQYHYIRKAYSRLIDKKITENNIELIISTTVNPFIHIRSKIPIINIMGGTLELLYRDYNNKNIWSKNFYYKMNSDFKKALLNISHFICASKYCKDSLVKDYNIPENKLSIIPYGANINDELPTPKKEIKPGNTIKFLFIGKQWERKGGELAVKICDNLSEKGLKLVLFIVGCKVMNNYSRCYIRNFEYLNKNNYEQKQFLVSLYRQSHFLLVPTQAEFFGIIFSEAASFGLPVISCKVGAVPEIVQDNETGILMDQEPNIEKETNRILEIINDDNKYQYMIENSKSYSINELNWDSFIVKLSSIIDNI